MRLLAALVLMTAACTTSTTAPTTTSTTTTSTTTTTTTTASTTLPPNVTAVLPNIGPFEGGSSVTITGTGFTGATAVMFNDQSALSFSIPSDSMIKAVAPPTPLPGGATVDVFVTTPNGTSVAETTDHFTFTQNVMNRFTLSDSSVQGGAIVVGTVGVQYVAPAAGYTLPVTWSSAPANSAAAIVPSSMRIESGLVTGSFAIQTQPVTSQQCYLVNVIFPPTGAGASGAFCVVP